MMEIETTGSMVRMYINYKDLIPHITHIDAYKIPLHPAPHKKNRKEGLLQMQVV
jgi:hypothetical protein